MAKIEGYVPGSFAGRTRHQRSGARRNFYSEMFGWTVNEQPIPGGTYIIFQS